MSKTDAYVVRQLTKQAEDYLRKANLYDPSYPAHVAYADTAKRYQQLAEAVAAGLFDQLDTVAVEKADDEDEKVGYSAAQLDGLACYVCGGYFEVLEVAVPTSGDDGRQLFAHRAHDTEGGA